MNITISDGHIPFSCLAFRDGFFSHTFTFLMRTCVIVNVCDSPAEDMLVPPCLYLTWLFVSVLAVPSLLQ